MNTVVLVDDNAADLEILTRSFAELPDIDVVSFRSAAGALDWLNGSSSSERQLVVTDLNMPVEDGVALLEQLSEACAVAPVSIVLSTSSRPNDVRRAYLAGANAYHVKPMGFHDTVALCATIVDYWFSTAVRPTAVSSL